MIITQISQKARPITAAFRAAATFGVPAPGLYSFNNPGNTLIKLFNAISQRIYLIERMAFSASVPGEIWSASTDNVPPTVTLYYVQNGREIPIDPYPFSLNGYTQDAQWSSWLFTEQSTRQIFAKVSGQLVQVAETVGKTEISANLQFSIYEMTDTLTNRAYVDQLAQTAGQQMRGAIGGGR